MREKSSYRSSSAWLVLLKFQFVILCLLRPWTVAMCCLHHELTNKWQTQATFLASPPLPHQLTLQQFIPSILSLCFFFGSVCYLALIQWNSEVCRPPQLSSHKNPQTEKLSRFHLILKSRAETLALNVTALALHYSLDIFTTISTALVCSLPIVSPSSCNSRKLFFCCHCTFATQQAERARPKW